MAPALQPPSRTATPTPIDALLAPLHLGSPASPPPSPSPTPSSPSTAGGLRSRKSTTALYTAAATAGSSSGLLLFGTDNTTPSPSSNTTALGIATSVNGGAAGWHSPRRGLQTADVNGKGKGRAVEQQHATLPSQEQEREVIVHKVLKTDSIASISLKYGITPQALRASNRLWPSDPLFLRSELLIPLDQCHLPSLSQHDVDLAQARRRRRREIADEDEDGDEDGDEDLMGWDTAAGSDHARKSRSGSQAKGEPPPPPPPPPPQRRGESLLDWSRQTTPDLTPTEPAARESSEFLTIWDDDDDDDANPHGKVLTPDIISGSLQYGGGGSAKTTMTNPFEIATGLHLVGSTTSSSLTATTAPGVQSLLREEIGPSTTGGVGHLGPEGPTMSSTSSPQSLRKTNTNTTTPPSSPFRRSSENNRSTLTSPSSSPSSPSPSSPSTTTLRIKRLPASKLAFFPAPSNSSSASSPLPSSSTLARHRQGTARTADAASLPNRDHHVARVDDNKDNSLFFRPLAKQLQQMSIPVPSFLVLSPSSSSGRSGVSSSSPAAGNGSGGGGGGGGRIRLPPSPNLAPSRPPTLSRKDSSTLWGTGAGGGGGWNLLDFGAEEDEANQLAAAAAVQLRQMQSSSSPPPSPRRTSGQESTKSSVSSSSSRSGAHHHHHHGNAGPS